jgi:hypothetical protein
MGGGGGGWEVSVSITSGGRTKDKCQLLGRELQYSRGGGGRSSSTPVTRMTI